MRVIVAGGHGKIGLRLLRLLSEHGDEAIGLIRRPEQASDIRAAGAEPLLLDLESVEETGPLEADAVVFAAGAGPGSGAERKWTMDRDGAIKLLEAAHAAEVERYVIVSSLGAQSPPAGDDVFSVYLRAKAEADQAVMASDRAWTIVRPGLLIDEPGTGRVRITLEPVRAEVSRGDVAAVLAAVMYEPRSVGKAFYVVGGEDPLDDALEAAITA